MFRLLLADDQVIVCQGLQVVIEANPELRVVGWAHDGEEAVRKVAELTPDLVVMDLKMPRMNGVEATRAIRAAHPDLPVLVLTTYDDDEWIVEAIRGGATGYLLKDAGGDELVAAILGTLAGRTYVDPSVAGRLLSFVRQGGPPDRAILDPLSGRERQVLRLLASGMTNGAIADRLALAEGTVRNHVSTILLKLGVADHAQATALAWRHGLVGEDRSGDGPAEPDPPRTPLSRA